MTKNLCNVRIVTKQGSTRVFLDGEEVKGCFQAELKWSVNETPVVNLDIMATEITVEIEDADVIKWQEVKVDDERTGQDP